MALNTGALNVGYTLAIVPTGFLAEIDYRWLGLWSAALFGVPVNAPLERLGALRSLPIAGLLAAMSEFGLPLAIAGFTREASGWPATWLLFGGATLIATAALARSVRPLSAVVASRAKTPGWR